MLGLRLENAGMAASVVPPDQRTPVRPAPPSCCGAVARTRPARQSLTSAGDPRFKLRSQKDDLSSDPQAWKDSVVRQPEDALERLGCAVRAISGTFKSS